MAAVLIYVELENSGDKDKSRERNDKWSDRKDRSRDKRDDRGRERRDDRGRDRKDDRGRYRVREALDPKEQERREKLREDDSYKSAMSLGQRFAKEGKSKRDDKR